MMKEFHLTIPQAIESLDKQKDTRFVELMKHGSMSIEYYAPVGHDPQTPHSQDELYVIASGKGIFNRDGEKISFNKGDVLFVPAGMEHRFEEFSGDFGTWVIFYGVPVGEPT
jgi:mannose-6-phosphate isomerase-like protein (cupin superfamily)